MHSTRCEQDIRNCLSLIVLRCTEEEKVVIKKYSDLLIEAAKGSDKTVAYNEQIAKCEARLEAIRDCFDTTLDRLQSRSETIHI